MCWIINNWDFTNSNNISNDQVVQEFSKTFEQSVNYKFKEVSVITLRRSTKTKRSIIPSNYIVYLQKFGFNIGIKKDPKYFFQAINYMESKLWYSAMKEEMNSIKINEVWDLVKLLNGAKAIWCRRVFKTKIKNKNSLDNI